MLLRALESKIRKLNSGKYLGVDTWLFIFSSIDLYEFAVCDETVNKPYDLLSLLSSHQELIIDKNEGWRGFSAIFVYYRPDFI